MSSLSVLAKEGSTVLEEKGGAGRNFTFYSKLLGCHVVGVKGAKKDKCKSLGEMFGFWLQDTREQFDKVQRKHLIATITGLITRDSEPDANAPLSTTLRPLLAAERRHFALSSDNTSVLTGRKKKNKLRLDVLGIEMGRLAGELKKLEAAESKRRKKEELLAKAVDNEALLKVIMEKEAKEKKEKDRQLMIAKEKGRVVSTENPESKEDLSAKLAPITAEYREVKRAHGEQAVALDLRQHQEEAYVLLQTFLDTLPALDKSGRPISLKALDVLQKLRRKQKDQLAISKIMVRCSMERDLESNDAFCGPREMMRVIGTFRSIMWVKSFMLWFKFVEQRKLFKQVGEKIGMGSAESLKAKTLAAFRANVAASADMKMKMEQASRFMIGSTKIRDSCFFAWKRHLLLLSKVDASRLRVVTREANSRAGKFFYAWLRLIENFHKAAKLFGSATTARAFELWLSVLDDQLQVFEEIQGKLRHLVLEFGDAYIIAVLGEWRDQVVKKKKANSKWAKSALWWAWGEWRAICDETWELLLKVRTQCSGVVSALAGQSRDSCFFAWRDLAAKNKRARLRFIHSSTYLILSNWRTVAKEGARVKRVIAKLRLRMEQRGLQMGFADYYTAVDDMLHRRSLVAATLFAWSNQPLFKAFRKLEEKAADKRLVRTIITDARKMGLRHVVAAGFRALNDHRTQAVRMRRIIARVRMRPCVLCLEAWFDLYQQKIYAMQREMANASPAIARFLKRAMVEGFEEWAGYTRQEVRRRVVLKRLQFRMKHACCVVAIQHWTALVDVEVDQRRVEVVTAARKAVKGGDLLFLHQTLEAHLSRRHVRAKYNKGDMRAIVDEALAQAEAEEEEEGGPRDPFRTLGAPLPSKSPQRGGRSSSKMGESPRALSSMHASFSSRSRGAATHDSSTHDSPTHATSGAATHDSSRHDFATHDSSRHDFSTHDSPTHADSSRRDSSRHDFSRHDSAMHFTSTHGGASTLAWSSARASRGRVEVREGGEGGVRGGLLRASRRVDDGLLDPLVVRKIAALTDPPEVRAHQDVTQYVIGVLPPARTARQVRGITRSHADAMSASTVPIPVSDYNYSSFEVRVGARLQLSHDEYASLPPRNPRAPQPRSLSAAGGVSAGGGGQRLPAGHAQVMYEVGGKAGRGLSLSARDLLPRQGDYGFSRSRTGKDVLSRLRHFESVMGPR